jgi:hypothetical protein
MIHLNPIEYPKLIKRTFKVSSISADKKTIQIDIDKVNVRLYYGKIVTFLIGSVTYLGTYTVDNSNNSVKHYLILDAPLNTTVGADIIVYEAFATTKDNQTVTLQDIQENLVATESVVNEFGESLAGKSGLQTGLQTLKANYSLYDFKKNANVLISNSFTSVCNLKIHNDRLSRYRIFLYDYSVSKAIFDAEIIVAPTGNYCRVRNNSHILQGSAQDNYQATKNIFNLKLQKVSYSNGENFLIVNLGLKYNNNISNPYSFTGYIGCKSANDLLTPSVSVSGTTPMLLNGAEIIECDRSLVCADTYGEQRATQFKETLFSGSRLTALISAQLPGHYVINGSTKPNDVPGGSADVSLTGPNKDQKFIIDWSVGNLVIYPTVGYESKPQEDLSTNSCLLITDNKRIFVGKINRTGNAVDWVELTTGTHTHNASDIITDVNHLFVTQAEKDAWNKGIGEIADSPWRPTVPTEADLPKSPINGYTVTVMRSTTFGGLNVVYQYANNVWKPISINVIPVMATSSSQTQYTNGGTLVTIDFITKVNSLGIGYQLNQGQEQFVSVLNDKTLYNSPASRFFDLVKRTTQVTAGEKSLNIGFDNNGAGAGAVSLGNSLTNIGTNAVMIGSGLSGENNSIILGRWNEIISGAILNIGIGASSADRRSAMYIKSNNSLVIKNGGYYEIEGVGTDKVLVSGGYIDSNNWITRNEFEEALDKKADNDKFGFFKHETYDGSKLEPIVFISGLYSDYEKYDV